ncbi:unnamed protein product [Parajaminaea phylloscopi]
MPLPTSQRQPPSQATYVRAPNPAAPFYPGGPPRKDTHPRSQRKPSDADGPMAALSQPPRYSARRQSTSLTSSSDDGRHHAHPPHHHPYHLGPSPPASSGHHHYAGAPPPPPPAPSHLASHKHQPSHHQIGTFARSTSFGSVAASSSPYATPLSALSTPSSGIRHSMLLGRTSHSRSQSSERPPSLEIGRGGQAEEDDDEIPGDDDDDDDDDEGGNHDDAAAAAGAQQGRSGFMTAGHSNDFYEQAAATAAAAVNVATPVSPSPSSSTGKSASPEKGRRTRVPQACDLCRKRKARCIGGRAVGQEGPSDPGQKCQRCTKQSADCQWSFFSDTGRQATTAKKRGRLNGAVVREGSRSSGSSHSRRHAHERAQDAGHERKLPRSGVAERRQSHVPQHNQFQNQFQQHLDPHGLPFPDASPVSASMESHLTPSASAPSLSGIMSPPSSMPSPHKRRKYSPSSSALPPPPLPPPPAPANAFEYGNAPGASSSYGGTRFPARQRTLEATALAHEAPPSFSESSSQFSQVAAVRRALHERLDEDEDDGSDEGGTANHHSGSNGHRKDRQAIVMEMTVPSATTSSDGNGSYFGPSRSGRPIPAARAIVSDGMNWPGKRKRPSEAAEPNNLDHQLKALANGVEAVSHPRLPQGLLRASQEELARRIRTRQSEAQRYDRATGHESPATSSHSAQRHRRASVGPSHPLSFPDVAAIGWLEDNPSQWTIEVTEVASERRRTVVPAANGRSGAGEAVLPVLCLPHGLLRRLVDPSLFAVTAHEAPAAPSSSHRSSETRFAIDASLQADDVCERRTSPTASHRRLRDVIESKLAYDQTVATHTRVKREDVADGRHGDVKHASHPSTPPHSSLTKQRGTVALGYEWPDNAETQESESQAWPDSQMLPPQNPSAALTAAVNSTPRRNGRGLVTDSQIKAIFELDEAGLASQQSQQAHNSASFMSHDSQSRWPPGSPPLQRGGTHAVSSGAAGPPAERNIFLEEEDAAQLQAKHAAALALNDLTQTSDCARDGGGHTVRDGPLDGDGPWEDGGPETQDEGGAKPVPSMVDMGMV